MDRPAFPTLMFDHIGIVTENVDTAVRRLASAVGASEVTRRFDDEVLRVTVRFVRDPSGMVYEMIAPFGEGSPVAQTLKSKTNLLNQIAYRTGSIEKSAAALRAGGNLPLGKPAPAIAFSGARVQFFFSPLGFVIELIEKNDHVHNFCEVI